MGVAVTGFMSVSWWAAVDVLFMVLSLARVEKSVSGATGVLDFAWWTPLSKKKVFGVADNIEICG